MRNSALIPKKSKKYSDSLFVFEGKNDFLIIGIIFLLVSFFLMGGFFFK